MSDNASGTPDEKRPDSSGNPPPSDPTASPYQPPSDPFAQPPSDPYGQPPVSGSPQQPPSDPYGHPPVSGSPQQPPSPYAPPPGQDPWREHSDPHQAAGDPGSGFGQPTPPPPGYGTPTPPPPGYGTQTPPPGYGAPGQPPPPGYGVPGQTPPGYGYPGQAPPPGYGNPGYGIPGQPPPGYGGYSLPSGYYAGPEDPLVSADFGGWWRRGFTLLGAVWQPMTMVQLAWAVPLLAVGIVAAVVAPDSSVVLESDTPTFEDFLGPFLVIMAFALATFVLSLIAQLATLDILVQRATGQPVSVSQALRSGLSRFFPLLGWQILAGVVVLVGLVFCFLPGIYAALVFMILPPIILLERGQGISRAFQLFHADFGAALGRVATVLGLYIAFAVVEGIFSTALDPTGTAGTGVSLFLALVSTAFSIASGVVVSPLILTAYADMRARHEPFSTAYLAPQPYGK
ncbi:hypothetical protein JIG36_25335 [Actinoplanes sp. LDG1-06]|uniref:Glycerophosphoryl diester phosphodiesterase membrane domain-containing protein n=1 Tax=Paractinoplanes ovalisporus TaxID=2810368 RepID=A0ABS2AGD2_9ACTN|nr:hypothetical protein [Actinoplanes ovalisporus]MBM2618887.1 hypothetical protein [Actinoplanes ovalisporus]